VLSRLDVSGARANATTDLDLEGNLLAVGDGNRGLHLVDVTDPTAPVLLGSHPGSWVQQVELVGDRLYVLYLGWPRVWAFDTGDLSAPVAQWNSCGLPCGLSSTGLDVRNDTVLTSTGQGGVIWLGTDPQGRLVPSPTVTKAPEPAMSVLAADDVILIGQVGGLAVAGPEGGPAPEWVAPDGRGDAHGVVVVGSRAYVAASFSGLQTFDVSDPLAPVRLGTVPSPGGQSSHDFAAVGITAHDDVLLLSDGRAGLSFYHLDNPDRPEPFASFRDGFDRSSAVEIADRVGYACADNAGVEIIDLSRPREPQRLAPLRFESGSGRACRSLLAHPTEPVLYMGDNRGLGVYDRRDPTRLVHVADYVPPLGGSVSALAVSGDRLFLTTLATDHDNGASEPSRRLQMLDVSRPLEPVFLWRSAPLDAIGQLSVMGRTLLMSTGASLSFFDIGRELPELDGSVSTPSQVRDFALTPSAIYVAQSTGGLASVRVGTLPVAAP
jgi:hypothetical protein